MVMRITVVSIRMHQIKNDMRQLVMKITEIMKCLNLVENLDINTFH